MDPAFSDVRIRSYKSTNDLIAGSSNTPKTFYQPPVIHSNRLRPYKNNRRAISRIKGTVDCAIKGGYMNVKPNDNDNLSLMFCYRKKNAIFTSLPIQPSDGNIPCLEQKTQKITKSNTTHQLRCLTAESNRQKKLEFYKSKYNFYKVTLPRKGSRNRYFQEQISTSETELLKPKAYEEIENRKLKREIFYTKNNEILPDVKQLNERQQENENEYSSESSYGSFEYLYNDTPGPGAYEPRLSEFYSVETQRNSYVQRFGVTTERFLESKHHFSHKYTSYEPNFKKSSKAPEGKVAFGASIVHKAKKQQLSYYKQESYIFYRFCEYYFNRTPKDQTNKTIKLIFKRSIHKIQKYIQKYAKTYQPILKKEYHYPYTRTSRSAISKKQRSSIDKNLTSEVEYKAQYFNSISSKQQRYKAYATEFNIKPPAFLSTICRFSGENSPKKVSSSQFSLHRQHNKSPSKGYRFKKNEIDCRKYDPTPSPCQYDVHITWGKLSFNDRYRKKEPKQ